MLRQAQERFIGLSFSTRLLAAMAAVTALNAAYCLAYRYSVGNPATLAEAFSWGAINLAPWVAAIEIGRTRARWSMRLAVAVSCLFVSLLLGAAYAGAWPDLHEVVRRLPGFLFSICAIWVFERFASAKSSPGREFDNPEDWAVAGCVYAKAAGNYVELVGPDSKPTLIRSTLSRFVASRGRRFVRIHRSYAVSPAAIHSVERAHVRLLDGSRLPIGHAYRSQLIGNDFVPSSP